MQTENELDPLKETLRCRNCGTPYWTGDVYCSDCGQKIDSSPPSLKQLFGEFFETIFNLDNRLFRSLSSLFVPAKLTLNYSAGRRKPFLGPLRFFFVTAVLCLATFSALIKKKHGESLEAARIERNERGFSNLFNKDIERTVNAFKDTLDEKACLPVVDALASSIVDSSAYTAGIAFLRHNGGLSFESQELEFPISEVVSMSPQQIADKYGLDSWFERYQAAQILRLQNLGAQSVSILMGQLIWGILILIPLCALWLKLIYIRRNVLYVEHFVFSLHIHTFLFLMLTAATLLFMFLGWNLLYWVTLIIVPIYFIASLFRFYKQSFIKTIFKTVLLFLAYFATVIGCAFISAIISVALF